MLMTVRAMAVAKMHYRSVILSNSTEANQAVLFGDIIRKLY
jgi:hypothetical protein